MTVVATSVESRATLVTTVTKQLGKTVLFRPLCIHVRLPAEMQ